jgi:broad-specificity NMP kinase
MLLENNKHTTKELLKEYFKLFPNDSLFPEWNDATDNDKQDMLKEAIKNKKSISETTLFKEKYEEKVIFTMDDFFNIEYIRNELIEKLKKQGYTQEKINELIKMCDEAYKDYKIPYPRVEELIENNNS